jgi:hypothetical protein
MSPAKIKGGLPMSFSKIVKWVSVPLFILVSVSVFVWAIIEGAGTPGSDPVWEAALYAMTWGAQAAAFLPMFGFILMDLIRVTKKETR